MTKQGKKNAQKTQQKQVMEKEQFSMASTKMAVGIKMIMKYQSTVRQFVSKALNYKL